MSLKDFAEGYATHVRIAVLRLLAEASEYRLNASIINDMVAQLGLSASRAQIMTQIAWLDEQGLVTSRDLPSGLVVATLTERGHDAAIGRITVPGVRRPGPSA